MLQIILTIKIVLFFKIAQIEKNGLGYENLKFKMANYQLSYA
jgi:hypothetical protein